MARHPDDNDKKPRSSQGGASQGGPAQGDANLRGHKPGDRPKSGTARPGSPAAARFASEARADKAAQEKRSAARSASKGGGGRAYAPDLGKRPEPRAPKPERGDKAGSDKTGGHKTGGGARGKPAAKAEPEAPKRSERIAKAMARAGVSSRREVERLIGLGKVAVNGRILDTPATLVTRDDVITVDGKAIAAVQATRVWRYNKPVGLLTSHNDPAGRPTVFDSLPAGLPRVISVGRLDINTEGLLLLTNDGELSRALELPATALLRQYRARARGRITQDQLDVLKEGVTVEGIRYGPVQATIEKAKDTSKDGSSANLWISVQITEGKNREVRKVLESVGLTVNRLIRLAYGPFQLGTLPTGAVEEVGPRVIRELLGEHIRPENLPQGNIVQTPVPVPGRRGGMPVVTGKSGSALSDPSRKPSRVRAAGEATDAAVKRAERPAKKAGWAKASPPNPRGPSTGPKREWKPRDPVSSDGAPKREFKPRADQIIGPKSPTWARDDKPASRGSGSGGARPSGTSGRPAGGARTPRPGGGKPRS